ncbi:MAG: hypothetical protein R3236_09920, partial [Phycisphaeraceae bacterium]|nr:hypothetical protein [Phycisphaeraceae bacterium]
ATRAAALRLLPAEALPELNRFNPLVRGPGPLAETAIDKLLAHPDSDRIELLAALAVDLEMARPRRLEAISGLNPTGQRDLLVRLTAEAGPVRNEALRVLAMAPVAEETQKKLSGLKDSPLLRRVLGRPFADHPAPGDLPGWEKALAGRGNPETGRRVFFGIGLCSTCHRHHHRGARTGPDLSRIGAGADRRELLKAIVQPSAEVAPRYQLWRIHSAGQTVVGFHADTRSGRQIFVDVDGRRHRFKAEAVTERQPLPGSVMPPGLLHRLTLSEARDLLTFLIDSK